MSGEPGLASREIDLLALAQRAVGGLRRAGLSAATAESLTGGLLAGALTDVPGASAVFRGGVVTYATDTKAQILGVPESLLQAKGPVDPDVAAAMALGVRRVFAADVGVATTGVAGPASQGDAPVGLVYVAVARSVGVVVRRFDLSGGRAEIRHATVAEAIGMLCAVLEA